MKSLNCSENVFFKIENFETEIPGVNVIKLFSSSITVGQIKIELLSIVLSVKRTNCVG
jgi:hypothetical protein